MQASANEAGTAVEIIHRSPGLTTIYNELKDSRRNNILDLGSASGSSFRFFSQLSCQIHFESLDGFLANCGEAWASGAALQKGLDNYLTHFDANKKFDIILAWDIFNYLDRDTLQWLIARLNPHCHANSLLHTIKYLGRKLPAAPRHFQIIDQYKIKTTSAAVLCSRPFASLDTSTTLKSLPGYVMEQTFIQQEGMAQDISEQVLRYQPDSKNQKRQGASAELIRDAVPPYTEAHRSYGLELICAHLRTVNNAAVLNLGSKATHSGDFFLNYADQVYVEDIIPSLIAPSGTSEIQIRQHALNYKSDLKFDVVLAWDLFNFCSHAQLLAIYEKLRPHLHTDTHIFTFFYAGREKPARPQKCYVLDDKNIALVPVPKRRVSEPELTAGAVLKVFAEFHLANTYILRPGMHGGIYEYIFKAGPAATKKPSA